MEDRQTAIVIRKESISSTFFTLAHKPHALPHPVFTLSHLASPRLYVLCGQRHPNSFSLFPFSIFVLYLEYTSLSTVTFLEKNFQLYPSSKRNYFESSNKYHNIINNTTSIEQVLCSKTVAVVLCMLFLIHMKTNKVGIIIFRDKQGGAPRTFVKCLRSHTWQLLRSEPTSVCSAAAAKSLQLGPTLCDPIDGSPPGSPVPGILQARTLEWVAISSSNA